MSPNDRLQFSILSLGLGERFHQHALLQPVWRTIGVGAITLVESMKSWGDALWEELQGQGEVAR